MSKLPTRIIWIPILAFVICGATVWAVLNLRPPGELTLAAGPADGAYHRIAQRYKTILARDNIDLRILETEGSLDNLARLETGEANVALLQGGVPVNATAIESIGKIFLEPVVFLRRAHLNAPANPALWQGLVINRGSDGSGTAAAFDAFRAATGLPEDANSYTELGYSDAVDALSAGEIDVAAFVAPLNAPYLLKAYNKSNIRFFDLDYLDAISRRWDEAGLAPVPAGVLSLDPVIPEQPLTVLTLEAHLAISPDLHPALVNRLTMAALELHAQQGILNAYGQFPDGRETTMPINDQARQIIVNGVPAWHRQLPYWLSAQLNRVLILLLPLLFILVPLLRALPAAYAYAMQYRVWQHYPAMRALEDRLNEDVDLQELDEMAKELAKIDDIISRLRLPAAYRQTAYHARLHIDLLQKHIASERMRTKQADNAQI